MAINLRELAKTAVIVLAVLLLLAVVGFVLCADRDSGLPNPPEYSEGRGTLI